MIFALIAQMTSRRQIQRAQVTDALLAGSREMLAATCNSLWNAKLTAGPELVVGVKMVLLLGQQGSVWYKPYGSMNTIETSFAARQ